MLRFAGFELDNERAELRAAGGEAIKLRPKTFALLQLFATNPNRLLTKQDLMTAIWPNIHVGEDSLFQCIREIRTALRDEERKTVRSISGRGYLFAAEVISATADLAKTSHSAAADPSITPDGITLLPLTKRWASALPRPLLAGAILLCCAVGVAIATPLFMRHLYGTQQQVIAVMPIETRSTDPAIVAMAAAITDRLTDGLSKIGNVKILAPQDQSEKNAQLVSASRADYTLRADIQREGGQWQVQARLTDTRTSQVQWSGTATVPNEGIAEGLQQSRLAAGIGYPVALRINALAHARLPSADARIIVEQAEALIKQTTHERFTAAQDMLEKGLAAHPNDVDIEAALAAHLLRGIQMVWYPPQETDRVWQRARSLLENVLRREPNYVPAQQAYCRLLINTNAFTDSLVACEKSLSLDPWDGLALFHLGMAQLQLGRFEDALATFERADAYDTPAVSRWTWLLGAGLTLVCLERDQEAKDWLLRSRAITPASGRTDITLALAYLHLGDEAAAREAIARGLKLRPGATLDNVALPPKNQSARYRARSDVFRKEMQSLGIPER